jgi:glycosyltransferase involved in cell wall biosynthesis
MVALWRRAHVFAMPSRGEGFGLVYIEAMRYGVPVIASIHEKRAEMQAAIKSMAPEAEVRSLGRKRLRDRL